jgi:hypothetical protein
MGNQKASSAAPLAPLAIPAENMPLGTPDSDQPRDFHFAVTWVTLFAHLDLIESTGPRPRAPSSPVLDLIPLNRATAVLQPVVEPSRESSTGWEMVVPRMIRTGSGEFTPAENTEAKS